MTLALNNKLLQTTVEYEAQDQVGAVAQDRVSTSPDIDIVVSAATNFGYGQFVALGPNLGVIPTGATATAANLVGVVKYQNAGLVDYAGYNANIYTNLPVLKAGVIYLEADGTIDLGDTLYLYVDPSDTAHYNKVKSGSGSGAVDISSIAKVFKGTESGLVAVDLQIL